MKKFSFLIIFIVAGLKSFSQDPSFFNTNQSLLYLNPSFAGSNGGLRYQFSYSNLNDGYDRIYTNSVDGYIHAIKAGIGVSYSHEPQTFDVSTSRVNLVYAQHLKLSSNVKLIPSVQFTYGHIPAQPDYLGTGYTQFYPAKNYFSASSGLLLSYKNKLYIGAYFFDINRPDVGLYGGSSKLPLTARLNASYNFRFGEKTMLHISGKLDRQNYDFMPYGYLSGPRFHYKATTWQLAADLLLFKHFLIGAGYRGYTGTYTSLQSIPFLNAGYRHNFFTISASLSADYDGESGIPFEVYSWELSATFNLRSKEKRHVLTSFENW